MATINPTLRLGGLAKRLVDDGILDQEVATEAIGEASQGKEPLVSYLVNKGLADAGAIANAASQEYGVPLFDLDALDPGQLPVDLVEEKLIRTHNALPLFRRGKRLFMAVADPTNHQGLDEIKFHTGLSTDAVLVEESKLRQAIDHALEAQDTAMSDLLDEDLENLDIDIADEESKEQESNLGVDDAPVVRYVNKILLDAINAGASDIHFEPYEKSFRIRLRQDGMLHEKASPPINIAPRLAARLKVMARLNIAERRVPQDGRIKMVLSKNRAIDFRVNTCPTLYGEKVVLRILDSAAAKIGIESLGFEEVQRQQFTEAIKKPYGMILVTGPTGSGKTVTLYTALNMLNAPEVNISTAEDPVEIQVGGINQVNVNPKTGLTFAEALRAFLRQDPDIVMVGEIRDLETAEIAIKAAQTGHLVLSKNRSIDFRVNTCPTLYGEKIVMRILDPSNAQLGIEALGFDDEQQRIFLEAIAKPYGMILVTGPTGSGKTVSLYTALNMLNKPEVNISTAEDPVEIQVTGINQVNVNTKTGLTFAEALRAFLRQDPDLSLIHI